MWCNMSARTVPTYLPRPTVVRGTAAAAAAALWTRINDYATTADDVTDCSL